MGNDKHLAANHRVQALSELEDQYERLKRERSALAHSPRQDEALNASTRMVEIAKEMYTADPTPKRRKNLEYATYYEAVSGCVVAQLSADFDGAKSYAAAAAAAARSFRESQRFFPNFFVDEADITSLGEYLDAVKAFREGEFVIAANKFDRWLSLNRHRDGKGDARYDSNHFHRKLSSTLDAIDRGVECAAEWDELEKALQVPHRNIYRTTRALWDHVEPLKAAARSGVDGFPGGHVMIEVLLGRVKDNWQLLSTSAPLTGKDREAGLEETVRLVEFVDVFHCLNQVGKFWRYLLLQSFRNALMLKSDYESRIAPSASSGDSRSTVMASFEIEQLSDADLVNYTRDLIAPRSSADLNIYVASTPMWFEARNSIRRADLANAMEKCRRYYAKLRSFPHVIRAKTCQLTGVMGDSNRGASTPQYRLVAERVWRNPETELTLETAQAVPAGTYAYLRPRWNRSSKRHYRIRDPLDLPITARMPEWMVLFERWASGRGPVAAEVFLQWCQQIDPRWRATALRLLSRLIFLNEADIRELWKELYRTRIPASQKGTRTLYVGLGRAAKSGQMQLVWLKQALTELPEAERSFDFKTAFQSEDALRDENKEIDSVVFVDDFFGTGDQAEDFTNAVLTYPWLASRSLFLCALAGFEDAINKLQDNLASHSVRVLVAKTLASKDRAFAQHNSLWDSDVDREGARHWCEELGASLLLGQFDEAREHALGWRGSEALIAFHSNTPNNTLPL